MRLLTWALVLLTGLWLVPATAQQDPDLAQPSAEDTVAIRAVISEQLAALRRDDADAAFAFAAPGIREQFRSARAFMTMVREGYGLLMSARSERFLDAAVIGALTLQPLELVGTDGSVVLAIYTMERQPDGRWRISGCELAPSRRLSI